MFYPIAFFSHWVIYKKETMKLIILCAIRRFLCHFSLYHKQKIEYVLQKWFSLGDDIMGLFQFSFSYVLLLFLKINLFIYFWLLWVFVAEHGLSLVVASRGYSSLWCADFSLWWLLLLQSTGSRCAGFNSCGVRAW